MIFKAELIEVHNAVFIWLSLIIATANNVQIF